MSQLGCRLMVGQEILVLFIMVRIRAPQPRLTTVHVQQDIERFSY